MAKDKNEKGALELNQTGIDLYNEEKYDEAEKYYQMALDKDSRFFYAYYNLALVEGVRDNQDKRVEYLNKAIEIKDDYSSAFNELGNYYYDDGEYEKAEEYYNKAHTSDAENKHAIYNLGRIFEYKNDYKKSREYYLKTLEIDSEYDLAKTALEKVNGRLEETGNSLDKDGKEASKSYLERIGRNLNKLALEGKLNDVLSREREIQAVFEILHKRFKNNPILIGQPGVGKTAIVEGIAQKIVKGEVPDQIKNKVIIEVNTGMLIAGTKYRGDFENKIKKILDEAKENKNTIIFIDEIHTIIGAGTIEDSSLDLAQMLKPALQNGEITCIGATTTSEYRKYIEKDAALERRFYPVMVDELSPEATRKILYHNLKKANAYYKINATRKNVDVIVDLTKKYMRKRYFPDKAIDVFEKLASRKSLKNEKKIIPEDVKEIISETTGMQFIDDSEDEMKRLLNMEDALKKEIFGQDRAIDLVCNYLRITKRRLDLRPERPDGVFMITGPTGVGKTFFARCLCKYLYGDESRLIQLDMSEYSEPHSVSKLIGPPPGYVGFMDVTPVTSLIEDNPTSILLLDEIEKADISVIRLFLQIFEDGKITNSQGKKIYFSDVTVIMTSNVLVKDSTVVGFLNDKSDENTDRIVDALSRFFPMEFLNRIDDIIIFNTLTESDIKNILLKNIFNEAKNRFAGEGIVVEFDDSVIDEVINKGYSTEFGARNLLRAFEKIVLSPIVNYIYSKAKKGLKLKASFRNDALKIVKIKI